MQNWIELSYAISAVASVIAAILAWVAKIRWSQEYAEAKNETLKAKDAQIALLEREIQTFQELTPMKLREYFNSVKEQLEEYNDFLNTQLNEAKKELEKKDMEILNYSKTIENSQSNVTELEVMRKKVIETQTKLEEMVKAVEIKQVQVEKWGTSLSIRDGKTLGIRGEELVLKYEKENLSKLGYTELAEKVRRVSEYDSAAGYDIESFTPDGKKKYIEVKTTRGPQIRPFYMSDHEKTFAENHKDSYYVYRVFDYDEDNNVGKISVLHGNLEGNLVFSPLEFKVSISSESKQE